METIANQLKTVRKQNGLTQQQLADKLCVSRQAISSWETGRSIPDIGTLTNIASFFNVPANFFFAGEIARSTSTHFHRIHRFMIVIFAILLCERITQLSTYVGLHWMNFIIVLFAVLFYTNWKLGRKRSIKHRSATFLPEFGLLVFGLISLASGSLNLFRMGFGFEVTCIVCGLLSFLAAGLSSYPRILINKRIFYRHINGNAIKH